MDASRTRMGNLKELRDADAEAWMVCEARRPDEDVRWEATGAGQGL